MSPLSQSCQIVTKAVQVISLGDSPRALELGTTPGKAPDDPALQDAPVEVSQVHQSDLTVADAPVEESRKVQEDDDKPSHFVCEVNKDGKPLGIRVEYVSDKCLVVAITQGAIPSWNVSNADGKEIRPGDRIVQVNGKDSSPSQLAQQLADAQGLVQMHIQRPGRVALQCKAEQKLGIKVSELQDGFGLEVSEVKEDGQIPSLNKERPGSISKGDRIVAVNGNQSDSKLLFNSISDPGDKELEIFTYA